MSKLFTEWVRHPDDENSWIPMRDVEEIPTVDDSKSYKIKYYGPNQQLLSIGSDTQPIYFYGGEPVRVSEELATAENVTNAANRVQVDEGEPDENQEAIIYIDKTNNELYYRRAEDIEYNITSTPIHSHTSPGQRSDLSQYDTFSTSSESVIPFPPGTQIQYTNQNEDIFIWYNIDNQIYVDENGQEVTYSDIINNNLYIDYMESTFYGVTIMPVYHKYNRAPANIVQTGNDVKKVDNNALIYIEQGDTEDKIYYDSGEQKTETEIIPEKICAGGDDTDHTLDFAEQPNIRERIGQNEFTDYNGLTSEVINTKYNQDWVFTSGEGYIPITYWDTTSSSTPTKSVCYYYNITNKRYYGIDGSIKSFENIKTYNDPISGEVLETFIEEDIPTLFTLKEETIITKEGGMQPIIKPATAETLGSIKVGKGLQIDDNGILTPTLQSVMIYSNGSPVNWTWGQEWFNMWDGVATTNILTKGNADLITFGDDTKHTFYLNNTGWYLIQASLDWYKTLSSGSENNVVALKMYQDNENNIKGKNTHGSSWTEPKLMGIGKSYGYVAKTSSSDFQGQKFSIATNINQLIQVTSDADKWILLTGQIARNDATISVRPIYSNIIITKVG